MDVITTGTLSADRTATEEVFQVSGTIATLLSANKTVYRMFDWGEEVVQEINDPDGESRATSYTYYGDNDGVTNEDREFSMQKSVTYPDGSWVLYEYNSSGKIAKAYRPWKDAPATASLATGTTTHLTEYSYIGSRLASEVTKVLGVETGRTTYVYTTGTQSGSGAALNIETVTRTPAGGPETTEVTRTFEDGGRVESIEYEDERRDSYVYEKGEYDAGVFTVTGTGPASRTTVTHGTASDPDGIANKATREVTIEDENGNTVSEETLVYTDEEEYERLNLTLHTYDEDGNLEETTLNGRVTYSATYFGDGKVEAETDEQGITTEFTYSGGNIATSTKKGVSSAVISSGTYAAQPDVVTTYEYDLLGRQVSEVVSSGSNSLPARTTTYTVVGDVETQSEGDFTTSYAYANGGRTTTVTLPTGATQITDNYRDGQLKSLTGTGVVHQYYDYGVFPEDEEDDYVDGTLWIQQRPADPAWAYTETTITDGSGRPLRIEKPTFDDTGLNLTEFEYNSKGQLVKESRTGFADTLYEYDELGRQSRRGLDMNTDDELTEASIDRINDTYTGYFYDDGDDQSWWALSEHREYFTELSGTASLTMRQKTFIMDAAIDEKPLPVLIEDEESQISNAETHYDRANKIRRDTISIRRQGEFEWIYRNGLLQQEKKPEFSTPVKYTYDQFGRQVGERNPRTGVVTTTSYDAATGLMASVATGTTGPSTLYEYYPSGSGANSGKLKKATQNGYATYYSWTLRGELYRRWGASYPVEYAYNDVGQLETMKTFQGPTDHSNPTLTAWTGTAWPVTTGTANVTTWEYNEATGLLAAKHDAASEEVAYTYNDANQLSTRTWARGVVTTHAYNLAGELTGKTYSDATPPVSITYNRRGLPAGITDGAGARTRTYAFDGRLDDESYVSGLLPSGWVLDWNYGRDYNNELLETLSLLANSVPVYRTQYALGAYGILASAAVFPENGDSQVTYNRVSGSMLLEEMDYQIFMEEYAPFQYDFYFDQYDRIQSLGTDELAAPYYVEQSSYLFNANNQNSRFIKTDASYWDYSYNAHGELEDATYYFAPGFPSPSDYHQWHYDNIGNRFESLLDTALTTYDANELNQYTAIDTPATTYVMGYDDDGNLVEDGKWAYTWDAENRLVSVQTSAIAILGGATPKKLVFGYDSENRRVSKTVLSWSGSSFSGTASHKLFLYDSKRMIAEVGFSGTTPSLAKSYYWGLDLAGWRDGRSMESAGGIGGLWLVKSGTNAYHPMYDAVGNVIGLSTIMYNQKAATYEYTPFGGLMADYGSGASQNPFRFSTKYRDEETGLIDFGYRFYNPETGRWLNRDPIGELGGVNLYAFGPNSPINGVDPNGNEWRSAEGDPDPLWIVVYLMALKTPVERKMFSHYVFGGGAPLKLTYSEYLQTLPSYRDSISFLPTLSDVMSRGGGYTASFYNNEAKLNGTLGTYRVLIEGCLKKDENGYKFEGTFDIEDIYNFNPHGFNNPASNRTMAGEAKVFAVHYLIRGKSYPVSLIKPAKIVEKGLPFGRPEITP